MSQCIEQFNIEHNNRRGSLHLFYVLRRLPLRFFMEIIMQEVEIVEAADPDDFVERVNKLLSEGFQLSSSSCGFVDSEKYDFCGNYQAILLKNTN